MTFTAAPGFTGDIPLPSPQVVAATLADGTQVLYRSLGNLVLQPSGRSVSGQAPATTTTSGSTDQIVINLDGDGARGIVLGTNLTAIQVAASLQAAVTTLAAFSPVNQAAYTGFRCDYSVTTPGAYTLRSGSTGPLSSVGVTASGVNDGTAALKLGPAGGGSESVGQATLDVPVVCDQIGVIGNVGAHQVNHLVSSVPGVASVANTLIFSNGREPASDDAYRQDILVHLDALGRGNTASITQAVRDTVGSDGQKHVMSFQVASGAGSYAVYLCDGRSLTIGCQTTTIQDVQDELDGLGQEPGGWSPAGTPAGAVSARVIPVPVNVTVLLGPQADLVQAQLTITQTIYRTIYGWGVGQSLSYVQLGTRIDAAVPQVLDIVFTLPAPFALQPTQPIGGGVGAKVMPAGIVVNVVRAG